MGHSIPGPDRPAFAALQPRPTNCPLEDRKSPTNFGARSSHWRKKDPRTGWRSQETLLFARKNRPPRHDLLLVRKTFCAFRSLGSHLQTVSKSFQHSGLRVERVHAWTERPTAGLARTVIDCFSWMEVPRPLSDTGWHRGRIENTSLHRSSARPSGIWPDTHSLFGTARKGCTACDPRRESLPRSEQLSPLSCGGSIP